MNGVLGLVDVLERDELSDYQKGLVKTIKRSAISLLSIIDDILDFSKIEAGRLDICNESVDVGELVEDLCSSLVLLALDKQVDLSVFIDPCIPHKLIADSTRLRQVLYNLIGNAIKFSGNRDEQRGRVSVRVELTDQQPPQLQIGIVDNGIGIAADRLDELFDPFTQAESDTTRRFGGTGLGLAISKRLVEMMQGVIRVESTPGEGSRFIVELPLQTPVDDVTQTSFWPDLSGVTCVLTPAETYRAEDIATYLQAAGAVVLLPVADEALYPLLSCQTPPVILITNGVDVMPSLEGMLASMPHVRQLRIVHGRRRKARVEDAEHVLLDGDALSREALLQAVSISAGYLSPVASYVYQAVDQLELQHKEGETDRIPIKEQLILVAEDDDINQIVILQQLRLLGYSSEIAGNGKEALERWRSGRFSLLLTDLHMPELDGYQLTEQIRAEESEGQHLPILALTANALRGESERARLAGMDAYLVKPVGLKKLQAALDEWLPVQDTQQESMSMPNTPIVPQDKTLSVLDISILKELIGDDQAITNELLQGYLESASHHTTKLMAAWQQHDLNEIEMVAHKLKSSSALLER
ncbi:ATP-binding protein [Nitrincola sp. A-D6]|uniref:ATP-binding protein n=1 Tax=Nitrincola sp. A-D6 TaxID=1545442 RepID=UPI00068988D7|nr:ATP-binding protein [Nitrincola sp. A-D6]